MTRDLLLLAFLFMGSAIGMLWARVMYGLIFPDNGARPGDPSYVGRDGAPDFV